MEREIKQVFLQPHMAITCTLQILVVQSKLLLANLVCVVTISNRINFMWLYVWNCGHCSVLLSDKHHLAAADLILIDITAPGIMCFNAVTVNFKLRSSSPIHKHLLRGLFCCFFL